MDEGAEKATRRKRVSRACDRCRSKKDKCDGLRPTCSACQASGQPCSYDPHAKKRGLPEGYVRGLEKLWALSLCNIDGFEETMLAMLGSTAESPDRREAMMSIWSDDGASDSLHETWKTSRLCSELERMLSTPEQSITTGKRPRASNLDDSNPQVGGQWGFRIAQESTPLGPEAPHVTVPTTVSSSHAKRARTSLPSDARIPSLSDTGAQMLRLPPQTSQLLDIYFAATHSWFPILAKHNILRASYFYATGPLSISAESNGSGDHAALWAILSYTVAQGSVKPTTSPSDPLSRAREYYSISRGLLPSEKERFELGHIQALLLLSLVNIGLNDWTAAWLLSGQAVRMTMAMGLGTSIDSHRADEERQGQAVLLGCFVIDSLLSFRLSRSPAMSSDNLATVGLLEEDGLEEWNSWMDVLPLAPPPTRNPPRGGPLQSLSCFNRLVELAGMLNKIVRSVSLGGQAASMIPQMLRDLKQWENHLPQGCRLFGPESADVERQSALLPHQSYLGLTYVSTLLWLHSRLAPAERVSLADDVKRIVCRGLSMITQHLEHFPMCGLPPIFDGGLRIVSEQATLLQQSRHSPDNYSSRRWAEEYHSRVPALASMWPIYSSYASSTERWPRYSNGPRTASGYARNGFSSLPRDLDNVGRATSVVHGIHPSDQASFAFSIVASSKDQSLTPSDTTMGNSEVPTMQSVLHQPALSDRLTAAPNMADRMFAPGTANPQPRTPDSYMSSSVFGGKPATSDLSVPVHKQASFSHSASTITSDLDAIFNDLAYLDTTEWSNNREAGLKDFGFLDDSTFQAFCHDPDRLLGSQPLVHPPSIEDIWPPPGFFPETFHEAGSQQNG
ncbi:hypothetical protein N7539_004438 [Penicillium diatomitis]|uniref:Zn(2)-C6 fungal-type domain-containing protein n=1 Tax=Penicillium diatomitis TaxID=2819901 RepID=A0A9W9XES9_9EURO|nr:uncharacterized protein N7539_004438 [Penicillium diatomitis]KAJ5489548.1 hypothetical protein N7539_004438 [Penicillium diatomitis]